jgi:hypothetical protein
MPMALEERTSAKVLTLPRIEKKAPRAYLVGATDTGKSTLMEVLMAEYRAAYSTSKPRLPVRILICDTKPRFRAQRELDGRSTEASGRYSKWYYGSQPVPDSYACNVWGNPRSELDTVWAYGGRVAIISAESEDQWDAVSSYARSFFEDYGARYPRLLVVDELADFFKYRRLGDIFQRVARNGRERDCGLIAGSQRPRKIPVEVMTEMSRLYMFELQFDEDLEHVMQFGIPRSIRKLLRIPTKHEFYMFDRHLKLEEPSNRYYELNI